MILFVYERVFMDHFVCINRLFMDDFIYISSEIPESSGDRKLRIIKFSGLVDVTLKMP